MKNQKKLLFVIGFLTSLTMGCSDVAFSPGPPAEETRSRGLSGTIYETFFATATDSGGKVDILFVVDNSTSMTLEQQRLGQRLDTFIGSLAGLDWQIGITTTDVTNGTYGLKGSLVNLEGASGYVLNESVANYEQVFEDTVVRNETINCVSDCPSSSEQPLAASIMAVEKRATDNSGFLRSDANLAIIMLSDEDEMSTAPSSATTPQDFVNAMDFHFGTTKKVTVFGIVIIPGDTICYNDQDTIVHYGTYVNQLAGMTGGLVGSICDNDYTSNLENIGARVKELQNEVVLSKDPVDGSLEIKLDPHMDVNYSLEGRKVVFDKDIPEGTKIDVSYKEL